MEVKSNENIRVYCHQDTIAAARIVQKWRTPKNKVATGRLTSQENKSGAFLIGTPTANSVIKEVLQLLAQNRLFAVLMPLSLVPELARLKNSEQSRVYDQNIAQKVESLSKIILPSSAQLWLISLNSLKVTKVLIEPEEGACLEDVKQTFKDSLDNLFQVMEHDDDWYENNASVEMLPLTRSRKRIMGNDTEQSEPTLAPAHSTTRAQSNLSKQLITPTIEHGRLSWKRSPREPLPRLTPVGHWVGSQLDHDNLPKKYTCGPPKGELIKNIPGHPADRLGIPNHLGAHPRIIVPKAVREAITMHTHEDIHHQNHQKATHILKSLYYWPGMDRDVERFISGQSVKHAEWGTIRRRHLKMIFDPDAPSASALPRQHHGLDFYGVHKGEILVIIDLFSREVILEHLASRFQLKVEATLLIEACHLEQRCANFFQNRQCARAHARRS
jgi:hypothetical protein